MLTFAVTKGVFMFSKTCEYGLRAIIFIAKQSALENKVGLKAIAKAIKSPEAFTAKILQLLSKNNIISSIKGPYGGFLIENEAVKKITLSQIVKILDGDKVYTGCALGLKQCNENSPCPLHFEFVDIRERLKKMLEETTLYSLLYTDGTMNTFWLK